MPSPVRDFAKEVEQVKMMRLADTIANCFVIEVHSGDREPGRHVSLEGRKWIVAGLRLLAQQD